MNKEPLIHITKRLDVRRPRAYAMRAISILIAFVLIGVLSALLVKQNPMDIYASIFKGAFGSERKIWSLLQELAHHAKQCP